MLGNYICFACINNPSQKKTYKEGCWHDPILVIEKTCNHIYQLLFYKKLLCTWIYSLPKFSSSWKHIRFSIVRRIFCLKTVDHLNRPDSFLISLNLNKTLAFLIFRTRRACILCFSGADSTQTSKTKEGLPDKRCNLIHNGNRELRIDCEVFFFCI